jgi:Spy/CpxP family protein refolding chaperone
VNERTPRQVRLMTVLLLFGTFVLGAVAGAGLTRWTHQPPPHRHAPFLPGPPGGLALTPEQEAKARAITDRYRPELEAVWRESMPKVSAINEKMEQELRHVLTPEQQKRLDELKAHRPPPPPGGPTGPGAPPPHNGPPHGGPQGGPPPWPGFAPPPPPPENPPQ